MRRFYVHSDEHAVHALAAFAYGGDDKKKEKEKKKTKKNGDLEAHEEEEAEEAAKHVLDIANPPGTSESVRRCDDEMRKMIEIID